MKMKPIKLVMSAFGPYLKETTINFSDLGDSGIYLITGDTGAGKSTIFEAISYALYGETVSGSGRSAAMLRNKSATDDEETYVELDFMAAGKRYHIYRSPKYTLDRFKKQRKNAADSNGSAQKKQAEHGNQFLLQGFDDGTLISKENDGNRKIFDIIGIGKDNFKKISMIAQGEFMSVIREKTEAREKILNSVFDTQNYVLLTEKLKDYRSKANAELESVKVGLLSVLSRLECSKESVFADDVQTEKNLEIITSEQLERIHTLAENIIAEDTELLENIVRQLEENTARTDEVKKDLVKAEIRHRQETELKKKKAEREALEATLPALQRALEEVRDAPEKAAEIETRAEVLASGLTDYDSLDKAVSDKTKISRNLSKLQTELETARKEKASAEQEEEAAKKQLSKLEGIEEKKADTEIKYQSVVDNGTKLKEFQSKFNILRTKQQEAEKLKQNFMIIAASYTKKKTEYDHIHKEFICNQAGILAAELTAGERCPVCGSRDHPFPAKSENKTVTKEQLDKTKSDLDKADAAMNEASKAAGIAKERAEDFRSDLLEGMGSYFGKRIESLEETEEYIIEKMKELRVIAKQLMAEKKKYQELIDEKTKLHRLVDSKQVLIYALGEKIAALTGEVSAESEKESAAGERITELKEKLEFSSKKEAEKHIAQLKQEAAMLKAKYESARSAVDTQKSRAEALISAEEVLQKQLSESDEYDLDVLQKKAETLADAFKILDVQRQELHSRISSNNSIKTELEKKKSDFITAFEKFNRCSDLYRTASGDLKGRDNVKLLSYVQAAYFERVLQRANIRLYTMSDGRYSLVRSSYAADKRKTTGLDIDVRDNESGKTRNVETLSGGESFMAALAMSLGLSDEIQSNAGGIQLETMFIDEGFGSLDDRALDKAVDALHTLSTGNCLIGIISHVGRLKEVINKRITVKRNSDNNTVAKIEL